ncbi:MAG TPA: ATP-binding protein [Candidatus Thermoplasmatota archaeon]
MQDLSDVAIRRAFNAAVLRAVRPLGFGLGAFYAFVAILAVTHTVPAPPIMVYPWMVSSVALIALAVVVRRRFFRPEWAHGGFAVLLAFVLVDSALLVRSGGPPALSVVFILILLGSAIIVLSRLFYLLVAISALAAWALATWGQWPIGDWTMWSLVLGATSIIGFAAQVSRERTLARLEGARYGAQRLAAIVEASHDAIISIGIDGKILTWNAGSTKLYGYSPEEAIGRHAEFLVPSNYRAELQYILDHLRRGESVAIPETFRRARNGELIPVAVSVAPIRDSSGDVMGGSSVIVDLRPRKLLDEGRSEAMRREAELRAAQQLNRLKSDFINVAAHELYTPLTPIKMRIHQLRGRLRAEDRKEALATLERNVDRLQAVVDEIVQVAQVQGTGIVSQFEPVELEALVASVVEEHGFRAKDRNQTLTLKAPGHTAIQADRERLKDAITNLVDNALKFTPDGGSIDVWVEADHDEAIVGVKDSGPGMAPERLEEILQHFSIAEDYVHRKEAGWGFGLFVSRRIIEAHGGRIWVHSEGKGKGSTFFVALPIVAKPQTSQT